MSETKPTRLLLVRHATNDWVGKRLAGWTPGVHLNARGQAQAEALGLRLAEVPLAAVYASPLERAQETAAAVLAARHDGLTVQTETGLGETRCGDWTGQALDDLAKSELWRQVQVAPSIFRFPGGESMAEAQARMVAALAGLVGEHPGETILVVSHSDPIKLVTAYYVGMPLDLFQRLTISPASITEFLLGPYGAHLVRCNDTAHIPAEPAAEPAVGDGTTNSNAPAPAPVEDAAGGVRG